jgi:endonuclease/exonuclease/phosphatase family metal-dependent hydrolase
MASTSNPKKNVSFLSYNLFCLPGLAASFSPSSCPLSSERSTGFLKHIPSYDIIALQEVWNPRYKSLEHYARQNNLHIVGSSSPSSLRFLTLRIFGGGLMIMSKYPMVDTQEIIFDKGSHSDSFVTKGVLYAKLKVESSFVHVFNTHLQASYGYEFDFTGNPYSNIRKKQLKKLAEFVQRVTANDNYPILLAGDFNVNARVGPEDGSDSKEYTDMLELLQHQSYKTVDILKEHNGGTHPVTYGGNGVVHGAKPTVGGQRLDFILHLEKDSSVHGLDCNFSDGKVVTFKEDGQVYTHISDHYAQSVNIGLHMSENAGDADGASNLSTATISLS